MASLTGRTALVTGASKGIGAHIAASLAAAGAAVAVNYVNDHQGAASVVERITAAGGRAIAVQADVSTPEGVTRLFTTVAQELGRVDVLVNNAGAYSFAPVEAITLEDFHRQVDTNLLATILTTQAFVAQRGLAGGSIVNLSTSGTTSLPTYSGLYVATKAAVDAFTVISAKELGSRGIRVNAIAPSASDTEGTRAMGFIGSEVAEQTAASIPLGRLGEPGDYGPVVAFLASDDARWITGDVILVSGGQR
jgi:3-oxoacyl-[acyl-carrier protein] reductase